MANKKDKYKKTGYSKGGSVRTTSDKETIDNQMEMRTSPHTTKRMKKGEDRKNRETYRERKVDDYVERGKQGKKGAAGPGFKKGGKVKKKK
jgi:hypothetical protein